MKRIRIIVKILLVIICMISIFKLSSDTGYKHNCLEEFAKDANLLICESTFLRGQIKVEDHHLFAHEAAEIAKKANVQKLVLTHFWPSIDKQKYVNEAKNIIDGMQDLIVIGVTGSYGKTSTKNFSRRII